MIRTRTRVVWDQAKVLAIVGGMPAAAHAEATLAAAAAAAGGIGGSGSGELARDVAIPKPAPGGSTSGRLLLRGAGGRFAGGAGHGRLASAIGSSLPYAHIEHAGGWIIAHNEDAYGRRLLYIRPGNITATAERVYHQGKRYLDLAPATYLAVMPRALRRHFPR